MTYRGGPLDGPVDLSAILAPGLAADPSADAIGSSWQRFSWQQLEHAADRLAAHYLARGLVPGDRVASLMPNRIELAIHYLACFRAGLVVTPLNYRYMPPEIDHALAVSGASMHSRNCRYAATVKKMEPAKNTQVTRRASTCSKNRGIDPRANRAEPTMNRAPIQMLLGDA